MSDKITIIQGEDKSFVIRLQRANGDAYDLSNVTDAEVCFRNADGSTLIKTLSVVPPNLGGVEILDGLPINGRLRVRVEDPESPLLKVGDNQDFEVLINENGEKKIHQFLRKLQVLRRVCFP